MSNPIGWPSMAAGMDTLWLNAVVSPGAMMTPLVSKNRVPLLETDMFSMAYSESLAMEMLS